MSFDMEIVKLYPSALWGARLRNLYTMTNKIILTHFTRLRSTLTHVICIKLSTAGALHDVITCTKFHLDN